MTLRPEHFADWNLVYGNPDTDSVRATFKGIPSGVVAVAADVERIPTVMVATSFAPGVSFNPPMASFAVQQQSSTWPRLRGAPRLGVSILGTAHRGSVNRLASRNAAARFDGLEYTRLPSGAVTLYDSPVWLECEVAAEHPAGDHLLVVLAITGSSIAPEYAPLIHHNASFGTFQAGKLTDGRS
ncbi:flavin reductase family protein [Pseudarthrobacter sp. SL88]|uniref:flavin reductase family protein n=1 Tax=Pseudarthrobacter sp. SL88 TaxID=2994666 RepID=UPI0022723702|nr:flavin reductase family protein [Pseudarthrobacter sp. SL88]MCY1674962.1 flavin reductase family protein [Pseudarthrobacter sp. SL88]